MDRVDDKRYRGPGCCQTTNDARLAAMGMHYVRRFSAEHCRESVQSQYVVPRVYGSHKLRQNAQSARTTSEERFQGTLGPFGGARNKEDFEARLFAKTKNRGDGIFLSSADDQPRDDVDDPHCGSMCAWLQLF